MRKFILLAGTMLSLGATPAAACDWERMGGPQRFNAFAKYHMAHASALDANTETEERADKRAVMPSEPAIAAEASTEPASSGDIQTPGAAAILGKIAG